MHWQDREAMLAEMRWLGGRDICRDVHMENAATPLTDVSAVCRGCGVEIDFNSEWCDGCGQGRRHPGGGG